MPEIAIQIVNYKTKKELSACVASLQHEINDDVKIYILENNSGDDLSDLMVMYPDIVFISSDVNLGFGGGHNEIAKHHDADIMILLNPDCEIIEKNTIQRLVVGLSADNVGAIGPRLVTTTNRTQRWDHGNKFAYANELLIKTGLCTWKDDTRRKEVNRVSGACFALRKDLFDSMQGFDEKFFMYKEEEDLCYRIRKTGKKIVYGPEISVKHIGGVTGAKRHLIPSNIHFIRKHLFHW